MVALSEVLRHFVALAGLRTHDPVVETRRALIEQIRARDAASAAATMAEYLEGLERHLTRVLRSKP